MSNSNFAIFYVHWAFWGAFGVTRAILRIRDRKNGGAADTAPISQQQTSAPFSRALLVFHGLAFAVMYFGIFDAVIPGHVPFWFPGQRPAGSLVIAGGAALMVGALVSFRSWRSARRSTRTIGWPPAVPSESCGTRSTWD
jgi:hypothetical protein